MAGVFGCVFASQGECFWLLPLLMLRFCFSAAQIALANNETVHQIIKQLDAVCENLSVLGDTQVRQPVSLGVYLSTLPKLVRLSF
jgi:hypothetical protein